MMLHSLSPLLRGALLVDAVASGLTGMLAALGAHLLAGPLGLPVELLKYAGLSLIPFAAALAWVAMRRTSIAPVIWAIIAANTLWVADSILLLLAGWVDPTALGSTFVVAQAMGVAALAGVEYLGLRKSVAVAARA
jgi:hypothetical protein